MSPAILNYSSYVALVLGLLGVVFTFLNRDIYKKQVEVYKPENEELRAINARKTLELAELETQLRVLKAQVNEKTASLEDLRVLNSKQPDFAALTQVMSNNHKELLLKVTSGFTSLARDLGRESKGTQHGSK